MKGQLNARMPGLRATRRFGTGGGSVPESALMRNRLAYLINPPISEAEMISTTPVTKTIVAATKGKYATGVRAATTLDSTITREIVQIGPTSMTELQLEINNWWLLANTTEEQINSGTLSVEASLTDCLTGLAARFTFGSTNSGTVPVTPGAARLVSDALLSAAFGLVVFPAYSRWLLTIRRTAASSSDSLPWHGTNQSLTRELEYEYQYASGTSNAAAIAAAYLDAPPALAQFSKNGASTIIGVTSAPTMPTGASGLSCAGGFVLLGRSNAATRAFVFVGDSISDGTADTQTPQPADTGNGWIGRALTGLDGLPYATAHKATMSTDRAQYRAGVNALSRQGFSQCTWAWIALGVNDIAGGRSYAQLTTDLTTLAALARAQGAPKVGGVCITPKTDASNTTPAANFEVGGVRDQVNTWIKSSGVFDDYIDFGSAIENVGTGLWSSGAYTSDGTHPLPAGCIAMANVARAKLSSLPLAVV